VDNKIIKFDHHGAIVSCREDLKGKHREYCLCFQCDKLFVDDLDKNCKIAQALFRLDILAEITTPVFYCKEFVQKESENNNV
jgi:hypothetical protein